MLRISLSNKWIRLHQPNCLVVHLCLCWNTHLRCRRILPTVLHPSGFLLDAVYKGLCGFLDLLLAIFDWCYQMLWSYQVGQNVLINFWLILFILYSFWLETHVLLQTHLLQTHIFGMLLQLVVVFQHLVCHLFCAQCRMVAE